MVHTFNPSTLDRFFAETGESLNLRSAQSIERVPGQLELHRENLKKKKKKNLSQRLVIDEATQVKHSLEADGYSRHGHLVDWEQAGQRVQPAIEQATSQGSIHL